MYPRSLTALLALVALLLSVNLVTARSLRSRDAANAHKDIIKRSAYNPFHSPEWEQVADSVGPEKRKTGEKQKRRVRKKACKASNTTTTVSSSASTSAHSSAIPSASSSSTLIVHANPATSGFVSTIASSSASSSAIVSSAPASSSTVTPAPSSTSTSTSIVASSTAVSTAPITVDPEGNGPFNGETTYYVLGNTGTAIGACGNYLVDSDKIAAASEYLFDTWPGATGNPNNNPICGLYAKVHYQGNSVVVRIEDRCPGCEKRHLDLSESAFLELAPLSVGMMDVTWEWVSGPNA